MSTIDELLANNERYTQGFDKGDLPLPPAKKIAILTCMDARLSPYVMLGLQEGDAHVIRNAGGVVTDDEIRSLAISQRLLGTEEIMVIHHTDCGMLTFNDDDFRRQIQDETGVKPQWAAEAFPELDETRFGHGVAHLGGPGDRHVPHAGERRDFREAHLARRRDEALVVRRYGVLGHR